KATWLQASRSSRTYQMDMLKYLTHKLRSQSLNEVQPFQASVDEDRDSGTESDEENAELAELERLSDLQDDRERKIVFPKPNRTSLASPDLPNTLQVGFTSLHHNGGDQLSVDDSSYLSENLSDPIADLGSSDLESERDSTDFEQYERPSSEEELAVINGRVIHPEKRKWSQMMRSSYSENSASSDEEVRDLLSRPQPVLFSSTPPQNGVKTCEFKHYKTRGSQSSPKVYISPVRVCTVSPRKRHKGTSPGEWHKDGKYSGHRPSLDFEKMQQKSKSVMTKQCNQRTRNLNLRTLTGGRQRILYNPEVFAFRSISASFNQLTPVEEPSCAY
ncbi:unnamed protein product, partial [Owenia fusiformis]